MIYMEIFKIYQSIIEEFINTVKNSKKFDIKAYDRNFKKGLKTLK